MVVDSLIIVVGLLAVGAAYFVGTFLGRSKGSKTGLEAASAADERAREQARLNANDAALLKSHNQRLLELIVNLPETVNKMGAARSTSALCRITVRALMDLVGARRVGLFMASGAPPKFRLEVFAGSPRPARKAVFELGSGTLGQLAELIGVRAGCDLSPGYGNDLTTDADDLFNPDLCISIRRHEKIYAFVAMDGIERNDAMTRRIVQMLADIHAVSAEGLSILYKERLKADIDQLTSLFNRRHLDRRLVEEMSRAQSYGHKLSVFLFDIDNFKHYNDSNGHVAGDECLQQVAAMTRQTTRGSDVVCRYGGEEFLVILLGANADEACQHAERIRGTIAASELPHSANQPLGCVSVSGGVACYPDDAAQPGALIELADRALYFAKENGRNRVLKATDVGAAMTPTPAPIHTPSPHRPSSGDLIQTPPPSLTPMISDSAMNELSTSLRAPEPVHTPLPVSVMRATPQELSVTRDLGPSPAITPLPSFEAPSSMHADRSTELSPREQPKPHGVYAITDSKRYDRTGRS